MMYNVSERKMEFISAILDQDTYMPSSGVYKTLQAVLSKRPAPRLAATAAGAGEGETRRMIP